jgi:2-methylisocitrate lyase-like PEP mutase family enzyme
MTATPPADLRRTFRALHESGCFVIPNPWDAGSARLLVSLGFRALATTSSGFAWSIGRRDNHIALDDALAHYRALVARVNVPISADFESGFAVEPERVADNVAQAMATGLAGLSIEDRTGQSDEPLFERTLAIERVAAARRAIDATGPGGILTARAEGFLVGRPDLDETVRRLVAYAEAGADCLYAPGVRTPEQITTIVRAVAPRAVNVLVSVPFATVDELAAMGVRRISVGGALARSAWAGFLTAAREIAERGTFTSFANAVPSAEFNGMFE